MAEETIGEVRTVQYVLKVRIGNAEYSVGPYSTRDEAHQAMTDIANGEETLMSTQRGTLVKVCRQPDSIEMMSFTVKKE